MSHLLTKVALLLALCNSALGWVGYVLSLMNIDGDKENFQIPATALKYCESEDDGEEEVSIESALR